jgi:hypothetical protein
VQIEDLGPPTGNLFSRGSGSSFVGTLALLYAIIHLSTWKKRSKKFSNSVLRGSAVVGIALDVGGGLLGGDPAL